MIKIVQSRSQDLEALRNLFYKARLATFSWKNTTEFCLSDFDRETENEDILVALLDALVVGFISVWVRDNFIHHLYVDEKFQGQGIGTLLLEAVLKNFGGPISLKCEEKNTKAINFYRQRGFTEIEKGQSESGPYILLELNSISRASNPDIFA